MTEPEMAETLRQAEASFRNGAGAAAIDLLLAALPRQAPERVLAFTRKAEALLTRNGARFAALDYVEAACRTRPGTFELELLRVAVLLRLGRSPEAARVLERLDPEAPPAAYWRYRAQLALGLGDAARALRVIAAARQQGLEDAALRVFEIKALMLEAPEAALPRAMRAQQDFPAHAGIALQQIRAQRAAGGPEAARALAEQALARFPEAPALHIELAEILRAQGDDRAAMERLALAERCAPGAPLPALHLALLHLAAHRPEPALAAARRALTLGRGLPRVELVHASCLEATGRPEEALACREALFARGQAGPAGLRDLIKGHLARGDLAAVDRYLRAGQEMFPGHPVLVEQLVRSSGLTEEDFPDGRLAAWLSACLPDPRRRRLQAQLRLAAFDFPGALAALRAIPPAERTAAYAEQRAKALLFSNRLELTMRYLRLALRHWPSDSRLAALVVATYAKAGQERAGLALLRQAAARGPEGGAPLARHLAKLHASLGEIAPALAAFRTALGREPERMRPETHALLRELAARGQGAAAAAVLREARAAGVWSDPHLHKTLQGQAMTELAIALHDPATGPLRPLPPGDTAAHVALVRAAPESNIAAMRFLQHWQTCLQPDPVIGPGGPGSPAVPRQIFQYWNTSEPPPAIAGMIANWRAAPGWTHRLFDRRAALSYLRASGRADWAQAFRLANNPAEESDFLRLCLLAREGGVYADADDILIGPLDAVVDRGAGFVAALEPGRSVIGNNFLAAAAGHPILDLAAETACAALLARANETTWSKTGPGMLVRATAYCLADWAETGTPADVALLDFGHLLGRLAIHNKVAHKRKAGDWRQEARPRSAHVFAKVLQESLERHDAATGFAA